MYSGSGGYISAHDIDRIRANKADLVDPDSIIYFRLGHETRRSSLENATLNVYVQQLRVDGPQAKAKIQVRVVVFNATSRRYEFRSRRPELTVRIADAASTPKWYLLTNLTAIVEEWKNRPQLNIGLQITCHGHGLGNRAVVDPTNDRVSRLRGLLSASTQLASMPVCTYVRHTPKWNVAAER